MYDIELRKAFFGCHFMVSAVTIFAEVIIVEFFVYFTIIVFRFLFTICNHNAEVLGVLCLHSIELLHEKIRLLDNDTFKFHPVA